MSYRSILVHLDASESADERIRCAIRLASDHDAHLIGLAPTGLVTMPPDIGGVVDVTSCVQLSMEYLRRRASSIAEHFEAQAEAAGLGSYESRVEENDAAEATACCAQICDLVVMSQGVHAPLGTAAPGDVTASVLLHSGRPVLVIPDSGRFDAIGHNVLVAWNASREAARASTDALPLLKKASAVRVITFNRTAAAPDGRTGDIAEFLGRHGLHVEVLQRSIDGDVGRALLSNAATFQADLVVMGGYGHARLREMLLGGATHSMLLRTTLPVLMSH